MPKNNSGSKTQLPERKNFAIESGKTKPLDKEKMTGKPSTNNSTNNGGGNQNRGN